MIKVDEAKCTSCELCVKSCVTGAIKPIQYTIDMDKCMGCSHCVSVCPSDAVSQDGEFGDYIENHTISSENFKNLVYSRKSIRNYKDKVIDDKTLNDFLNLMQYAPTGTNSQKIHVTVINNREKLQKFSVEMISFFKVLAKVIFNPATYLLMLITQGKTKTEKLFGYKRSIVGLKHGEDILTYNAPLVIVFHASPEASTPDMDCNIQSAYASLHAVTLGLGTCFNGFITRGLNANKKMKRELGIPKKNKVYSSLLVGYPELNYKKRVIREELKVNIIS